MTAPRWVLATFPLETAAPDAAGALDAWLSLTGSREGCLVEDARDPKAAAYVAAAPSRITDLRGPDAWRKLASVVDSRRVDAAPAFWTGAFAQLDYEAVGCLERLPLPGSARLGRVFLFDDVLILEKGRRPVLSCLIPRGSAAARQAASERAAVLAQALRAVEPARLRPAPAELELQPLAPRTGRAAFMAGVRALKRHIAAGDIFQAVLSESFELPVEASALEVYRALREASPAPYSYWLRDGERDVIGASPERLVRVVDGEALNCPIAGTRPRGKDAAQDALLTRQLTRSPKERAEHLMLVDLARNDLGRVCAPGSVRVRELMKVRKFSNVMHLVSEVEGRLDEGKTRWDALAASFPAGTVSGAPKVRAMELIAGLEGAARGFYAGAFLQADHSGNLDSCIAIRSLELCRGRARLQAGAGIVTDSSPEREWEEIVNKLGGLRRALALADGRIAG